MDSIGRFKGILAAVVCWVMMVPVGEWAVSETERILKIDSFEELCEFSRQVSELEGNFSGEVWLMCDLQAEGEFTPVGSPEHMFLGIFDGRGHSISGLRVSGGAFCGLFGYVGRGGTVRNLTLCDPYVAGSRYSGGIAGYSAGRIEACSVSDGRIVGTGAGCFSVATGGIAGLSSGEIIDCSGQNVCVIGSRNTGGIVGNQCAGQISRCISVCSVWSRATGHALSGGIAGSVRTGGEMNGCISAGRIYAPRGSWAGGVIGGLLSGKAKGCVSVCEVIGREAGGFAGYVGRDAQTIACRYSRGFQAGVGEGRAAGTEPLCRGGLLQRKTEQVILALLQKQDRVIPSMRLNVRSV